MQDVSHRKLLNALVLPALLFGIFTGCSPELSDSHPKVIVDTNHGTFELTLDGGHAPKTVLNFLAYVDTGFYDGTVIHRITSRMFQGGGYDTENRLKKTREPVENEASEALSHVRGTIAMARDDDIHSATSQFFINHKNNTGLDSMQYTVFGAVTAGMDVIDKIATIETYRLGPHFPDYPASQVRIISMRIEKEGTKE